LGNLDLSKISSLGFRISAAEQRRRSTTVEDPLQIAPFMQNEPNFRKAQMNLNFYLTKDYEKRTLGKRGKNKPNTNPIQTQYKPNTNPNKANFPAPRGETNPIQSQSNPISNPAPL